MNHPFPITGPDFLDNRPQCITLNREECKLLHDWCAALLQVLGSNSQDVFEWNENDDINNPLTSALFKLYQCAGARTPIPRTKAQWLEEIKKEQEAIAKENTDATS